MTEEVSPQGIASRSSLEILVAVDMTSLPQLATRLAVKTAVDPRTQIDATTRSMWLRMGAARPRPPIADSSVLSEKPLARTFARFADKSFREQRVKGVYGTKLA